MPREDFFVTAYCEFKEELPTKSPKERLIGITMKDCFTQIIIVIWLLVVQGLYWLSSLKILPFISFLSRRPVLGHHHSDHIIEHAVNISETCNIISGWWVLLLMKYCLFLEIISLCQLTYIYHIRPWRRSLQVFHPTFFVKALQRMSGWQHT